MIRKGPNAFWHRLIAGPALVNQGRIEDVLPTSCGARSTREFDDLRDKLSAWMSFRSAMALQQNVSVRGWEIRTIGHATDRDCSWASGQCATL